MQYINLPSIYVQTKFGAINYGTDIETASALIREWVEWSAITNHDPDALLLILYHEGVSEIPGLLPGFKAGALQGAVRMADIVAMGQSYLTIVQEVPDA